MSIAMRSILEKLVKHAEHPGAAWDIGGVLVADKPAAIGLGILEDPQIVHAVYTSKKPGVISTYWHLLSHPDLVREELTCATLDVPSPVYRASRERALTDALRLRKYLVPRQVDIAVLEYALQVLPPANDGVANVHAVSTAVPASEEGLYWVVNREIARSDLAKGKVGAYFPRDHLHALGHQHKDRHLHSLGVVLIYEPDVRKLMDPTQFYVARSTGEMQDAVMILAELTLATSKA